MTMISETVILQALIHGLLNGSILVLISIGFTLIFGGMGIINFACGQLTVVSMYHSVALYCTRGM